MSVQGASIENYIYHFWYFVYPFVVGLARLANQTQTLPAFPGTYARIENRPLT